MTRRPLRRSFADRLTLAATATSGLAVVLVATLLALADYADVRREVEATARTQARIVALSSGAALMFGDPIHGADVLSALRAAPDVVAATLLDRQGRRFASYRRGDEAIPPPGASPLEERVEGRWLVLSTPVIDLDEVQGRLEVVYDLSPARSRLQSNVAISILIAFLAMLLASLAARRLLRQLAAPIGELAEVANRVSATRDYSLRAADRGDDELGQLTRSFNEMLERIGHQARDLATAHAERGALLESERAARAEAERASRMKDDFVATLSHELRTPLTPIVGWVDILRRSGPLDERTRQALDVIDRNVRLQTRMIDDLLDMSRIVSGKIRLDVQLVDPATVIESALATVRPAAEAREIQLVVDLRPDAGVVRADPNRLQQIVWNLLSNAIKFSGQGGRVEVSLARRAADAEIRVRDYGQGILPEFLPHVFDRFRQADSSMARRHGGLGLGLAIVRQLVELHGGTVRAESEGEGRGAEFVVTLPQLSGHAEADALEASRDGAAEGERAALAGVRVLIAEDDRDARELIGRLLEINGATVEAADSAGAALERLAHGRFDVLVSDIGMPGVDGYELLSRVRALGADRGSEIPAIALTAFARSEDRTRALRTGYQMHVAKPVEPAELIAAVASVVARRAPASAGGDPDAAGPS